MIPREAAQERVNRIRAFRAELVTAESDGAIALSAEQRAALDRYHGELVAQLTRTYDVDRSEAQYRLSLGMRIVSLLGAAALTGAVVLFFLDIWGALPSAAQIAIAWAAPLVALAGAAYAAHVERTRYFTAILSFLALGCFMMNVAVLGTVFNSVPSTAPLLVWSAFALLLAYRWDLGWMLAAGAVGVLAYFATSFVTLVGFPLDVALQRPEVILAPAAAIYACSLLGANASRAGFPAIYRRAGLVAMFLVLIVLGEEGNMSFLRFSSSAVEAFYQVVSLVAVSVAIWIGVRNGWRETLNIAAVAGAILLLLRYVDWWWEWMPTYLFFLIVAATAIGALIALRQLRRRIGAA